MEWHCRNGVTQNLSILEREFNEQRGLKPIKIFITGPPASGKSYYGQKLAEHYNVPHIKIQDVVELLLSDNSELGKKV